MKAGKLDRRVALQEKVISQDAYGQPSEDYVTRHEVWAEFLPLKGTERFVSQQTIAQAVGTFRIRYIPGITPIMRLRFEGRNFDITDVREIGRRVGLDIEVRGRAEQ